MRRSGPFGIRLPRAVSVAVLGVCALLLSSCGTPSYTYLQDDSLGTYFKVPHGWTVLGEDEMLAANTSMSPSEKAVRKQSGWVIGAASRLVRAADGTVGPDPDRPWVVANVFPLSQQTHDVLSKQIMENAIRDLSQLPADSYTTFFSGDVVYDGGFHGIRRAYEVRGDDGTFSDHVEQVLTNPATSLLYTLQIVCSPDCFQQYGGDINAVLNSWTIKEP
jgi:hypothetical protein